MTPVQIFSCLAASTVLSISAGHAQTLANEPVISAAVKYVEADEFLYIGGGTCIVKKGPLYQLVGVDGQVLVPYGKYEYHSPQDYVAFDLIKVYNIKNGKYGFINTAGREVIPTKYNNADPWLDGSIIKVVEQLTPAQGYSREIYFDHTGKQLPGFASSWNGATKKPVPVLTSFYVPGGDYEATGQPIDRIPAYIEVPKDGDTRNTKKLYGFLNREGKTVIPFKYEAVDNFSGGMACVGETDQFGKRHYGFINLQGELTIPCKFSIRPGNFRQGMSLVQPQTRTDFDYAYINTAGDIVHKVGDGKAQFPEYRPLTNEGRKSDRYDRHNLMTAGAFYGDYALWMYRDKMLLLHRVRKTFSDERTVLQQLGATAKEDFGVLAITTDGIMYTQATRVYIVNDIGVVSYEAQPLFPPRFDRLIRDISHPYALGWSRVPKKAGETNFGTIHGVVNSNGEYILLLKPKEQW